MKRQKITITKAMHEAIMTLNPNPKSRVQVIYALCRWAIDHADKQQLQRYLNQQVSIAHGESVAITTTHALKYTNTTIRSILSRQLPLATKNGVQSVLYADDYYQLFTPPLAMSSKIYLDQRLSFWLKNEQIRRNLPANEILEQTLLMYDHPKLPPKSEFKTVSEPIKIGQLSGAVRAWLNRYGEEKLSSPIINNVLFAITHPPTQKTGEAAQHGKT